MLHEERRRLIEAPIRFFIAPRHTWGGVLIGQKPGARNEARTDESFIHYGGRDEGAGD